MSTNKNSQLHFLLQLAGLVAALNAAFGLYFIKLARSSPIGKLSVLFLAMLSSDLLVYSSVIFDADHYASTSAMIYLIPVIVSISLFTRRMIVLTAAISIAAFVFTETHILLATVAHPTISNYYPQGLFVILVLVIIYVADNLFAYRHERASEDAQAQMITLATHQLRTPATAVKGFLSFILDGDLGKLNIEQLDFLKSAYRENEIQLRLIDNILSVAKLELNSIQFHPKQTDLKIMLTELKEAYRTTLAERHQELTVTYSTPDTTLVADKQLLRMCFDNLLSNASRYSRPQSAIKVLVSGDRNNLVVSFEDSGEGVPKSSVKDLFKRFTRIERKYNVNDKQPMAAGGSGVGLYLVKHLIKLHGGKISVVSYEGEGSIFTLTIPRKAKEEPDGKDTTR